MLIIVSDLGDEQPGSSITENLKNKLTKLVNTQVRVSEVYNKGKKLYRVRLGPFNDVRTARNWIIKLEKMSFNQASLVYLN